MRKNILKIIIPLILVGIAGALITYSSISGTEKKKVELLEQKILAEQQAERNAIEKIYLTGKFDPSTRPDFTPVPQEYNVAGYKMYLRKETLDAFMQMAEAADKDGVKLRIASATRNFDYQKGLWDNKWVTFSQTMTNGLDIFNKILEYSAVPGTSRHHWGTEIDFNSVDPKYYNNEPGEDIYDWLVKNASQYGFCQTYTAKGPSRPTGYNEEKWHWSYLPLSKNFTQEYKSLVTPADITGFDGDQYVGEQDLISNYVLGINPECL